MGADARELVLHTERRQNVTEEYLWKIMLRFVLAMTLVGSCLLIWLD